MLLLVLQICHSLNWNRSLLLLAITEILRSTTLRSFSDSSKQSNARSFYEGLSSRTGWMDYDGIGSCLSVAVKVFCFGHEPVRNE